VSAKVSEATSSLEPTAFPSDSPVTPVAVAERIQKYDAAIDDLVGAVTTLGRWGLREHRATLANVFSRMAQLNSEAHGGFDVWLGLRWYPLGVLFYASSIAALAGENYALLGTLFSVHGFSRREGPRLVFMDVNDGLAEARGAFRLLPGHDRHRVPGSEYLYIKLQQTMAKDLHLGGAFEHLFDRFEILNAIAHVSRSGSTGTRGPLGRFWWKRHEQHDGGPLARLEAEAKAAGNAWAPLASGLYDGSIERFLEAAATFRGFLDTVPHHS
jgi:hypothetical protein